MVEGARLEIVCALIATETQRKNQSQQGFSGKDESMEILCKKGDIKGWQGWHKVGTSEIDRRYRWRRRMWIACGSGRRVCYPCFFIGKKY